MRRKKEKEKKKSHVPFRLNILFLVVFLLFSGLILRLGFVQIVNGENYSKEVDRTENVIVSNPVPRGRILDRQYNVVVDNESVDAITYTRLQGTTTEEMIETAEKMAMIIQPDITKITERNKKDFWILKNKERAAKKITKEEVERNKANELSNSDLYKLQVERVTEAELKELTIHDIKVIAIYREMASAKALSPVMIKNKNVSHEELAKVSENLESLPGIDVTTDWNRKYLYDQTLRSIIGKVSTIPSEKIDYYLARDYNLNDRVGTSYLELQYEDVLHGQKEKVKNITDKSGRVLESIQVSQGARGKDLVLTIDVELQLAVEKIIEEELKEKKSQGGRHLLDRAFVVLMDPHTGEVLTMAGKRYAWNEKTGKMEISDYARETISTSYAMGSSVKGATVLMGYETGAIRPGESLYDSRLNIKGTPSKGSVSNMGWVNDLTALKRSSNVYMFLTAMKMGGYEYQPNQSLPLSLEQYDQMRYYYNQFGLGVRTGIDLPIESAGVKGPNSIETGKLLDLAIGQYDMYTPMQLAQYISTIANGGKRIKPHLVKEIREPSIDSTELGPVVQEINPVVLNHVDMDTDEVERVQEGFRQVMQENQGTAAGRFRSASYSPAGKTGTAQAFYDGPLKEYSNDSTINTTLVAYAPHNDPEVAMAVVVPWAYNTNQHAMSQEIGRKVLDTYFSLQKGKSSSNEGGEMITNGADSQQ